MNNYMAIKWTTCRNGQVLRRVQSPKTEPVRHRKYMNRPSAEIETVIENFPTNKSLRPDSFTGKFYQTFREELSNLYPSETVPKSCREKKTSQFISWGHHHPDTKTRQRYHKKRKLQANITDEDRCKNPQQNTSNLYPTIH